MTGHAQAVVDALTDDELDDYSEACRAARGVLHTELAAAARGVATAQRAAVVLAAGDVEYEGTPAADLAAFLTDAARLLRAAQAIAGHPDRRP